MLIHPDWEDIRGGVLPLILDVSLLISLCPKSVITHRSRSSTNTFVPYKRQRIISFLTPSCFKSKHS